MQYDTVRHSCHGLRLAPPVARRNHNYLQALIHHACKAGSPLLAGIFSVYSPLKKSADDWWVSCWSPNTISLIAMTTGQLYERMACRSTPPRLKLDDTPQAHVKE